MYRLVFFIIVFPSICLAGEPLHGRGEVELRVCAQNLHNFGAPRDINNRRQVRTETKIKHLLKRVGTAGCDVIAVQEVFGESKKEAVRSIGRFAKCLAPLGDWEGVVGDTRDERITNGFVYKRGVGKVLLVKSFDKSSVPKLQLLGPVRYFARGPLLLRLKISSERGERIVSLFSIHFKSKASSWKDPTKTKFESFRMEMAERVRELVLEEQQAIGEDGIVMVLGDRNSDFDSASAKILTGERTLEMFIAGGCSLKDTLEPSCGDVAPNTPILQGIIEARYGQLVKNHQLGSYRYKGVNYLLDEILILKDKLWLTRDNEGEVVSGLVGKLGRGSDHLLLFTELNW